MKLKDTNKGNYKLTLTPYELKVLASLCTIVKLDQTDSANVAFCLMEEYACRNFNLDSEFFDVTGTIGEFDKYSLGVTIHD